MTHAPSIVEQDVICSQNLEKELSVLGEMQQNFLRVLSESNELIDGTLSNEELNFMFSEIERYTQKTKKLCQDMKYLAGSVDKLKMRTARLAETAAQRQAAAEEETVRTAQLEQQLLAKPGWL